MSVCTNKKPSMFGLFNSKLNKFYKPPVMFKCNQCGETDRDIAEKYCGNERCQYKL